MKRHHRTVKNLVSSPATSCRNGCGDDDVDDSVRAKIEDLTGEDLVDEDYDSAVDGAIVWWRDGDDEDELSDTIVDAYSVVGDDGPFWVLTPKPGRTGAASSSTVQSAAKTAGMNAAPRSP